MFLQELIDSLGNKAQAIDIGNNSFEINKKFNLIAEDRPQSNFEDYNGIGTLTLSSTLGVDNGPKFVLIQDIKNLDLEEAKAWLIRKLSIPRVHPILDKGFRKLLDELRDFYGKNMPENSKFNTEFTYKDKIIRVVRVSTNPISSCYGEKIKNYIEFRIFKDFNESDVYFKTYKSHRQNNVLTVDEYLGDDVKIALNILASSVIQDCLNHMEDQKYKNDANKILDALKL